MICEEDYIRLLYTIRHKLQDESCDLFSVVVYGSVCRLEMVPGFSDIDLLVIIKEEYLTKHVSYILNRVITDLLDVNIKIHLRIRNIYDLESKTSGLFDCGVTSAINKLRDSIVLVGESLDSYYLSYLKNVQEEEIISNLHFRFSDLRYQNRALLSMHTGGMGISARFVDINYKAGCILFQLAELICYSKGIHFENSKAAIYKAKEVYDNQLLDSAEKIKNGDMVINVPDFVSEVDQILNSSAKSICKENVNKLLHVRIIDDEECDDTDFISNWRKLIKNTGFDTGSLVVKKSKIDSGFLVIKRYRI